MAGISWHYVLKFIITGDSGVGKSSLLVRLTDERFLTNPDPTLGVEFGSKLITIPGENKVVKLQCWDTAGTESFRSITRSYYRGAAGCLLVYDVTSRRSFENIRIWLADVRAHADPHLTAILVGNKVDLCDEDTAPRTSSDTVAPATSSARTSTSAREPSLSASPPRASHPSRAATSTSAPKRTRQVTAEEAERYAQEEGLLFVEASAKSGANVEHAFEQACTDILSKISRGVFDDGSSPGVKPLKPSNDITLDGASGRQKAACCT